MNELVSVIIPVYNAEKYIKKCINSIINQSYKNIEILICDDKSTDSSWDMLNTDFNDSRIKLFRNRKNEGVVYTRNLLLQEATGLYIMLQDADDRSHPDRILKQLNCLRENPKIKACGTQFIKCYKNKTIRRSYLPTDYFTIRESIPDKYYFLPATLFFEANILSHVGYYSPFFSNDGNEDIYWISKIIINYPYFNLSDYLYFYELNITSLTKTQVLNKRKYYIHEVTNKLLKVYKETGTNELETSDELNLVKLENNVMKKYTFIDEQFILNKLIGQLLHFNQFFLALKIVFSKRFCSISIFYRIKIASYIVNQWIKL